MDRTTVILLCIGFIIVWVVFKRLTKKPQQRDSDAKSAAEPEQSFDLDKWFGRAQDVIGAMDGEQRDSREEEWRQMEGERQLALADEFLQRTAAAADAARLSADERRRVGWAYFLSRLES